MKCINLVTPAKYRDEVIDDYNLNSLDSVEFFNTNKTLSRLRRAKDIKGENKYTINLHKGGEGYNSSQGCFTIYNSDYDSFLNTNIFNVNKLGLLFLFRS